MKKIGFIDYFLDEFHANKYPAWIRSNIAAKQRDCELTYAWAEQTSPSGMTTEQWCETYGLEPLSSLEELVDKSDYIIVLAPNHPEHHERLSQLPLMSGKPVYIDKTFSPDTASGQRLFALAEKHNTPMFSSSALRFSKELADFPSDEVNRDTIELVASAGPGTFDIYAVHQFEMLVSLMGPGMTRIKSLSTANGRQLIMEYPDGRQASMLQMQGAPFQLGIQTNTGSGVYISQCTDFFPRLIDAILDFFESGKPAVPKEETLAIMALIEAGRQALSNRDTWIEIPQT